MTNDQPRVYLSYAWAGMTVLISGLVGIGFGCIWTRLAPGTVVVVGPWAQIAGAAFVLWSVLGRVGWSIQTWNGNSQQERADKALFYTLNVIGVLCLISGMSAMAFRG